jgi:phage tail-like protein
MPAGLGPSMPNDAISAARFSITVDGYEIAQFSELTGITTEVDVIDFMENGSNGANILKKLPGKRKPPTITLRRGKNTATSSARARAVPS